MKMPPQFYIFAIVLLSRYWPWHFGLLGADADYLLTVIVVSHASVIACNILSKESWVRAIIIIEAVCMMFNVTIFLFPALLSGLHGQIMLAAFIIELLIITISLQGAAIGGTLPMAGSSLRDICRAAFCRHRGDEVSQ